MRNVIDGPRPRPQTWDMLHAIRTSPLASASDPVELLVKCHDRMRHFVGAAARAAAARDPHPAGLSEAIAGVRRYFTVALPLHEADEERSIAPRLLESPARRRVEEAIEAMVAQHAALHGILAVIDPMWERIAANADALVSIREPLVAGTDALGRAVEEHLALEEEHVLPAIARTLTPAARASIVTEIRSRRASQVIAEGPPTLR
jgi:hypothetical protein